MKIFGYWGRFDAPYVKVRFVCKRFGIDRKIRFLIDLGASSTIISEKDAEKLKIDYTSLQKLPKGMAGIGGRAKTYFMDGVDLYFESDRGLYRPNKNHIFVIKNAAKRDLKIKQLIPSLLGRDFLNQMALLTDHRQDLVLITDEVLTV
jgi:hypothetical protein